MPCVCTYGCMQSLGEWLRLNFSSKVVMPAYFCIHCGLLLFKVQFHVYTHVYTHAYTRVYTHVCMRASTNVCVHIQHILTCHTHIFHHVFSRSSSGRRRATAGSTGTSRLPPGSA